MNHYQMFDEVFEGLEFPNAAKNVIESSTILLNFERVRSMFRTHRNIVFQWVDVNKIESF